MVGKATRFETSRIWVESDLDHPVVLRGHDATLAVHSKRMPGKSEANDDAAAVFFQADGCVMAVADGVGGAPLGNQASAIAVQSLENLLCERKESGGDLRPVILDAIELANREILDCQSGSATTLTVVEVRNHIARVYQVGDSMAVIFGGRGTIKYRSVCHSPVGYAIESGWLDEDEAMHHEERHFVSNLVGSRDMSIEVGPAVQLNPRDTILLGSDGLFDNVSTDEAISLSLRGDVESRMNRLVDQATARMIGEEPGRPSKPDDLTVILSVP